MSTSSVHFLVAIQGGGQFDASVLAQWCSTCAAVLKNRMGRCFNASKVVHSLFFKVHENWLPIKQIFSVIYQLPLSLTLIFNIFPKLLVSCCNFEIKHIPLSSELPGLVCACVILHGGLGLCV